MVAATETCAQVNISSVTTATLGACVSQFGQNPDVVYYDDAIHSYSGYVTAVSSWVMYTASSGTGKCVTVVLLVVIVRCCVVFGDVCCFLDELFVFECS